MNSILPQTTPPDENQRQNAEGEPDTPPQRGNSPMAFLTLAILAAIVIVAIVVSQGFQS